MDGVGWLGAAPRPCCSDTPSAAKPNLQVIASRAAAWQSAMTHPRC